MYSKTGVSASRLLGLLFAALAYTAVVCLHECGHWGMAQAVGFHARVFRVGLGEPHFVIGQCLGTEIRLSPWLLGGGVQISELLPERVSQHEPVAEPEGVPGQRTKENCCKAILVLLAGPMVSLICALVLALLLFRASGLALATMQAASMFKSLSREVVKALLAIFLFRQQESDSRFDYFKFLELPWRASENPRACLIILISTTLSQAIFNFLPVPVLDGGKICFQLSALVSEHPIDPAVQTVMIVISELFLFIVFLAAIYRGFRWPFPKG